MSLNAKIFFFSPNFALICFAKECKKFTNKTIVKFFWGKNVKILQMKYGREIINQSREFVSQLIVAVMVNALYLHVFA